MAAEQPEHAASAATAGDDAPATESDLDQGIWLSITELAERFEIAKATVSARVTKFEDAGLVKTKPGKGKIKLVNLADFESAIEESGDPAKEQGAETKSETADDPAAARDPRFRDAATKEKQHLAQLAEIRVGKELGKYIEAEFFRPAVEECAEVIVRILDRPISKAADLEAAARSGGVNGVRVKMREIIREQRAAISEAMQRLADTPTDQPAPLPELAEADEPELPLDASEPAQPAEKPEAECDSNSGTPLEA